MNMKSLLALALVGLAAASPLQAAPPSLSKRAGDLIKRSSEGVYLSNCDEFEPGILFSEMDYYSNAVSGSQSGQHPNASAYVSGGHITWEGQQVCATFSASGDTFCSNIDSGAQSYATGAYAGWGYNNEVNFNCYKDNGRTLYTITGVICNSIYYCFDA